jgi:hypothetical protein
MSPKPQEINVPTWAMAVIGLMCALLFSGCTTTKAYPGDARPSSELALLRGYGVTMQTVNAVQVGITSGAVKILPGPNEVKLTINASNFNSPGIDDYVYTLKFNAEAGKEYVITSQRGIGRVCAWLVNPLTGSPDFTKSAGCLTK